MPDLPERLAEALKDRYTLQRELGRGGMATVYLATDRKHDRSVALKVLKPELAAVLGPERFLREVKIAAQLTHPHILPLHDSGNADGFLYYIMPYVEGESLRDRLNREKQLPVDDALQISREVADALSFAHSHGVIHRDIKPENILLGAGHAVVADFGIARAVDAAGGDRLTETGVTLGTPVYMSPEQAAGSRDLDGRSDLYSLGCVVYEMLAGQPPFTGPTVESLIQQHLTAEPPNITNIRPSVPSWVVAALQRALAKTPADRFNPVAQFGEAIAPRVSVAGLQVAAGDTLPVRRTKRWLVWAAGLVLAAALVTSLMVWGPLGTLVRGGNDDGLPAPRPWVIVADFDGTAEPSYRRAARDLVSTVVDQSAVVATLPSDQIRLGLELAGKPDTTSVIAPIARELAVRGSIPTVVTGTVDRVGNAYSLLLRALEAESGAVIAAANGRTSGEDEIVATVERLSELLLAKLGDRRGAIQQGPPLTEVATPSFAAYRKYAEAIRLRYAVGNFRASAELAGEAIALDSGFAAAWLLLGVDFFGLDRDSAELALQMARQHEERLTDAGRLDLAGVTALLRGDNPAAIDAFERLVRHNPNDLIARNRRANAISNVSYADAIHALKDAEVVSPFGLNEVMRSNLALWSVVVGRREEAREIARTLPPLFTPRVLTHVALAEADWALADSLSAAWDANPAAAGRGGTRLARASVLMVRGEVAAARRALVGRPYGAEHLLIDIVTGWPAERTEVPRPRRGTLEGTLLASLTAASRGDVAQARHLLQELRSDTVHYLVRSGAWPQLVEAAIAAAEGDWAEAARAGSLVVAKGVRYGPPLNQLARWLVAVSFERSGQLDSATAYLQPLAAPAAAAPLLNPLVCGIPYSFAHQRLVVLYARLGRLADARRHWRIFSETFTQPDPEVAQLIDEARAALEAAERKAG